MKHVAHLLSAGVSAVALAAAAPAFAQAVAAPAPTPSGTESPQAAPESQGLTEIVVTAQKREQSLQDVPVAVTALTQSSLEANRVMTVTDLSGLAPNVTVRASAGGSQIPAVTSRGVTSFGVVPGSDKEFSIYLDGVYLGSSHSLFDLPDIARIEVLRGPQGTLFGRNSTAGAVSVITRDPKGRLGLQQSFTMGNFGEFRTRTTIDTPAWGPFSAYASFVHEERRGDIKNLGAGTFWDRTGPNTRMGAQSSPRNLGSKNQDQVFAAVKFEPSDNFSSVYKFDYQINHFTPEGTATIAFREQGVADTFRPALGPVLAPLYAAYFASIVNANNPDFVTNGKRPDTVNNSWAVAGRQKVYGHNLTSNLRVSDNFTLKNIAAYRYSFVTSASQISGLGGLNVPESSLVPFARFAFAQSLGAGFTNQTPAQQNAFINTILGIPAFASQIRSAAGIGGRLILTDTNAQSETKQWSDELQANYDSQLLTLTVGGLWFHQKDLTGGPPGIQNTPAFFVFPASGRVPLGAIPNSSYSGESDSYNKATSIAAYAQGEIHATDTLDVVLGGRLTHDRKSGRYDFGGTYVPPAGATMADSSYYTDGTFTGINSVPFKYRGTKFTYSAGVNYKPSRDLLVYAKYSTGFVSGGSIAGLAWKPETVSSVEAGVKADLLDRRLRANLALFHAKYKHIQTAQGGTNLGRPEVGTAIVDLGDERAQGAELEITALPIRNLTLGANLGYTDAKYTKLTDLFVSIYGTGYQPTLLPKWTSNLYAQYETDPVIGDARITARIDADWRSRVRFLSGSKTLAVPEFASIRTGPPRWILNTRIAIEDLGPAHLNVAFWTRNLTNNKDAQFPLSFLTYAASASFQQARTYGLDVSVKF